MNRPNGIDIFIANDVCYYLTDFQFPADVYVSTMTFPTNPGKYELPMSQGTVTISEMCGRDYIVDQHLDMEV